MLTVKSVMFTRKILSAIITPPSAKKLIRKHHDNRHLHRQAYEYRLAKMCYIVKKKLRILCRLHKEQIQKLNFLTYIARNIPVNFFQPCPPSLPAGTATGRAVFRTTQKIESETNPGGQIGIGIIFKLAKKGVVIGTEEQIHPPFHQPIIINFIAYLWPQVDILIGRRIIGEAGKIQILVKQQFGKSQGEDRMRPVFFRHPGRQDTLIIGIIIHVFQVVLNPTGEITTQFMLKTRQESLFTIPNQEVITGSV
jgi:hypothetical protein